MLLWTKPMKSYSNTLNNTRAFIFSLLMTGRANPE